jgi:hypothetical protein
LRFFSPPLPPSPCPNRGTAAAILAYNATSLPRTRPAPPLQSRQVTESHRERLLFYSGDSSIRMLDEHADEILRYQVRRTRQSIDAFQTPP